MAFVVPWILVAYFDELTAEEMGARVQAHLYMKVLVPAPNATFVFLSSYSSCKLCPRAI